MKTKQAFNPYLPSWEYVPDAEPHIVGDRVYVYGSHDLFNGINFCLGGYVCWTLNAEGKPQEILFLDAPDMASPKSTSGSSGLSTASTRPSAMMAIRSQTDRSS